MTFPDWDGPDRTERTSHMASPVVNDGKLRRHLPLFTLTDHEGYAQWFILDSLCERYSFWLALNTMLATAISHPPPFQRCPLTESSFRRAPDFLGHRDALSQTFPLPFTIKLRNSSTG
jgi:hypothetical protein